RSRGIGLWPSSDNRRSSRSPSLESAELATTATGRGADVGSEDDESTSRTTPPARAAAAITAAANAATSGVRARRRGSSRCTGACRAGGASRSSLVACSDSAANELQAGQAATWASRSAPSSSESWSSRRSDTQKRAREQRRLSSCIEKSDVFRVDSLATFTETAETLMIFPNPVQRRVSAPDQV